MFMKIALNREMKREIKVVIWNEMWNGKWFRDIHLGALGLTANHLGSILEAKPLRQDKRLEF